MVFLYARITSQGCEEYKPITFTSPKKLQVSIPPTQEKTTAPPTRKTQVPTTTSTVSAARVAPACRAELWPSWTVGRAKKLGRLDSRGGICPRGCLGCDLRLYPGVGGFWSDVLTFFFQKIGGGLSFLVEEIGKMKTYHPESFIGSRNGWSMRFFSSLFVAETPRKKSWTLIKVNRLDRTYRTWDVFFKTRPVAFFSSHLWWFCLKECKGHFFGGFTYPAFWIRLKQP